MIKKFNLVHPEIETYAEAHTTAESVISAEIQKATEQRLKYTNMLSGRVIGRLLAMLIKISGARKVLELGTFTGNSAISMAEALPDEGELITIEMNSKYADIAREFFQKSEHGHKIKLLFGTVDARLPNTDNDYDLIFLDVNKDAYPKYYEMLLPKLKPGGLLVIDNVLWYGGVLENTDRKSQSLDQLNKMLLKDNRVEHVLLTVRDGIQIVRKKEY